MQANVWTEQDVGREITSNGRHYTVVANLDGETFRLQPVAKSQGYQARKQRMLRARLQAEAEEAFEHEAKRDALRFERENPRPVVPSKQLTLVVA